MISVMMFLFLVAWSFQDEAIQSLAGEAGAERAVHLLIFRS